MLLTHEAAPDVERDGIVVEKVRNCRIRGELFDWAFRRGHQHVFETHVKMKQPVPACRNHKLLLERCCND